MKTAQPFISIEAEQSVLGSLLVDNTAWDRVADLLKAEDFSRREHRAIFEALGRLINSMKPADVVTVLEELRRTGNEEDGSLGYLNVRQNVDGKNIGTVVAMGPDAYQDKDRFSAPWCKIGDVVGWKRYQDQRYRVRGVDYVVIADDKVDAVGIDPDGLG